MPALHLYQLFAVIYLMSVVILIIRNSTAVLLGTSDEDNNIDMPSFFPLCLATRIR